LLLGGTIVIRVCAPAVRARARAAAVSLLLGVAVTAPYAVSSPVARAEEPDAVASVVSDNPAGHTPHALDGAVRAITQVGSTMIAGGTFTSVRSATNRTPIARSYLFAFDAVTGELSTTFVPQLNAPVDTLAPGPDGRSVFVGGSFTTVNGAVANRLVRLDIATGLPTAGFSGGANGRVLDLAVSGNRLYLAGMFTAVRSVPRAGLAAVDVVKGVLDRQVDVGFTTPVRGTPSVLAIDVSPAGDRLVAIGNFLAAGGLERRQVAVVDLSTSPASVSSWATTRYTTTCSASVDTYLRDVDISPDGRYFVIVTSGAWRSGGFSQVLCDTAARWELAGAAGEGQQPTWVNYTGGDTLLSAKITKGAIYIGGHQRWFNNPWAGDAAGPGAVARSGIGALDPVNGLPLSWNPGRTRGVGAGALLSTPDGLWVGSDTERLGGEYHGRLGFFPAAGGKTLNTPKAATVPGRLSQAQAYGGTPPTHILHRINAGGPRLLSRDGGPDWGGDTAAAPDKRHSTGSSVSAFGLVPTLNPSVPASTPPDVFSSERYDGGRAGDGGEMTWNIPVAAGTPMEVRLYFANRATATAAVGKRQFDVKLDGTLVLDNYDIVAAVGHDTATMRAFRMTSDGNVDLDFLHVLSHPLINAIEIVRTGTAPPPANPDPGDHLITSSFDGNEVGPATTASGPGIDGELWSQVRGGFVVGSELYHGSSDGRFYVRSISSAGVGPASEVSTNRLAGSMFLLSNVTGMYYDRGRLYYTLAGDARLLYRYFTPESRTVGAEVFVASGEGDGLDWSAVEGLTMAVDPYGHAAIYAGHADGHLRRTALTPGDHRPVADSTTMVSGPSIDGRSWQSRGLWIGP